MTSPDPTADDAFQRAAEELWMPVYRFALALNNDLGEADDVAQEAFVRLWRTRATILHQRCRRGRVTMWSN